MNKAKRYESIIQKNLFRPLGYSAVKREEFVLIGTVGESAFIQEVDTGKTLYIVSGESFSNNAQLVRVEAGSVTIVRNGNEQHLLLRQQER